MSKFNSGLHKVLPDDIIHKIMYINFKKELKEECYEMWERKANSWETSQKLTCEWYRFIHNNINDI